MVQSIVLESSSSVLERVSSHPSLIDQIESILNSPCTFTTSTPTTLLPLLERLEHLETDEEGQETIVRLVKWCEQLDDAVSAAHAREVIAAYLREVISWPEWTYSAQKEQVEIRKNRVDQIKGGLSELPIEWLKSRVTGIYFPTFELEADCRVTKTRGTITSPSLSNDPYYFLSITSFINSLCTITSLYSPLPRLRYFPEIPLNNIDSKIISINTLRRKASRQRNFFNRRPFFIRRSRTLIRSHD